MEGKLIEKALGFHDAVHDPIERLDVVVRDRRGKAVHHYRDLGGSTQTGVEHAPVITRSVSEVSGNQAKEGSQS